MTPEPPLPDVSAPPEPPPPESYPFWSYLDLSAFVLIAALGVALESVLAALFLAVRHVKQIYVLLPAQCLLYGYLLGALAVIFHRYYQRPLWQSLRWESVRGRTAMVAASGIGMACVVVFASLLIRTPDVESPMKALLSDPTSAILLAVLGVTIGPICEEIVFRGFLQPLLVRSLGAVAGVLLAAVPFGLLHLQEYGYSWRHALLITLAGASFGWMRQRTGSTKAAALMHASYNGVFFLVLVLQQVAVHGRWAGYAK
ncbi:MAG TPA: type II CAAX endopeptidase family protein [Bryobacteraceae bacterium]|nr:type II CAAX endopeptidase family protein [Bryobacteraceae bacterium]